MKKILLLSTITGTGGINSWTRKYIKNFKSKDFKLIPVDRYSKHRDVYELSLPKRMIAGFLDLYDIRKEILDTIKSNHIDILHTTTSGSLGTFRDYIVARISQKYHIKSIMHCRYGCIPNDIKTKLFGFFLYKTMCLYDEIWVLDTHSEHTLKKYPKLKHKIYVIPNSIAVEPNIHIQTNKSFTRIAFIGNIIPSKGIFELVEAVTLMKKDVELYIIGNASNKTINQIIQIAGPQMNKRVFIKGQLSNKDAIDFMKTIDTLVLPTYYPWEGFPISILEAMSLGKLVVSTPRAAIPDMLTDISGKKCGILVKEKSINEITIALDDCISHPDKYNNMCQHAYEKAYSNYRDDIVYKIYETHYENLVN